MTTSKEIDDELLSVISESLEQFGQNVSKVVFWRFRSEFDLDPTNIPKHIAEFSNCLKTIFGEGSKMVEIRISRELTTKFRIVKQGLGLVETVEMIRKQAITNEIVSS